LVEQRLLVQMGVDGADREVDRRRL
jgi:hypothetical protein